MDYYIYFFINLKEKRVIFDFINNFEIWYKKSAYFKY